MLRSCSVHCAALYGEGGFVCVNSTVIGALYVERPSAGDGCGLCKGEGCIVLRDQFTRAYNLYFQALNARLDSELAFCFYRSIL